MTFRDWFKKIKGERPTPPPAPTTFKMSSGIEVGVDTNEVDAVKYIRMMNMAEQRAAEAARALQQAQNPMTATQIAMMQRAHANSLFSQMADQSVIQQMMLSGTPVTSDPNTQAIPPRPKIPHPMTANVPPLLVPFGLRTFAQPIKHARVATIKSNLSGLTMDKIRHWPKVDSTTLMFGDMIVSEAVMFGDKYAVIIGIDPCTLAYYMRLFYTLVQYVPELPRTLEMLQVVGYERVFAEFEKLPGVSVPGMQTVKHLMYEDRPWCIQFREVLKAALANDIGTFINSDCSDKREIVMTEQTTVPLVAFLEASGAGAEYLVTVRQAGTFWQVGHPVAMDWAAVT
jgi:hypothetical protein